MVYVRKEEINLETIKGAIVKMKKSVALEMKQVDPRERKEVILKKEHFGTKKELSLESIIRMEAAKHSKFTDLPLRLDRTFDVASFIQRASCVIMITDNVMPAESAFELSIMEVSYTQDMAVAHGIYTSYVERHANATLLRLILLDK